MAAAILPKDADQILTAALVPKTFKGLVMHSVKLGKAWSCWKQGKRAWLFTAAMSSPSSRDRGAPVLRVNLYSDEGSLLDSADIMRAPTGKWQRCVD